MYIRPAAPLQHAAAGAFASAAKWPYMLGHAHDIPPARETAMDDSTRTELEAAAFRSLVGHLRERTDVQNIDLMNLSGFCRNCLSRWYQEAAEERGIPLDKDGAREIVYGMPFAEWREKYQTEATEEQKARFKETARSH